MEKRKLGWLERPIQGLTFWIGHRRSLYPYRKLVEGALAAELANLVHASLKNDLMLACEVEYSKLKISGVGNTRADMVILSKKSRRKKLIISSVNEIFNQKDQLDVLSYIEYVIEVKRAPGKGDILKEFERLSKVKRVDTSIRALVVAIFESNRPSKYVSKDGKANKRGKIWNDKHDIQYSILRVLKASASFTSKSTAHYAVVFEIN